MSEITSKVSAPVDHTLLPNGGSVTAQWIDSNVQNVRNMLQDRMHAGYKKYGTTTERTDIDLHGWLQHLQEELLDAAVYIERLKKEVKNESK